MILRTLALAGGLSGAAILSQYPEFSQQYLQRLGGQIDALSVVVADFDASAAESGLTREAALAELEGSDFLAARQADMGRTFARHKRLMADRAALEATGPLERLLLPHRLSDAETLQGTWADYQPAVPLTIPSAVSAGAGFLAGWAAVAALTSLLRWPFRRRPGPQARIEPPLTRPPVA